MASEEPGRTTAGASPPGGLGDDAYPVPQRVGKPAPSQVALPQTLDVGRGVGQLPGTAVPGSGLTSVTRSPRSSRTYRIAPAKSASFDTTTACSYFPLNPSTNRRVARFTSDPFCSESLTRTCIGSPATGSASGRYSLTKTETATEGGLDPTVESIGVVSERYHEAAEAVNKTFDHDRPMEVSWGQEVGPAMQQTPRAVAPPVETR